MKPPGRTFLITGTGRVGTKWLAQVLDRDPDWDVLHEPYSAQFSRERIRTDRSMARAAVLGRFARADQYGEVNSQLRFFVLPWRGHPPLRATANGLLVREPAEVMGSIMNRRASELWSRSVDRLLADFRLLDTVHSRYGFEVFRHDRLFADMAEVRRVAEWAGVRCLATEADLAIRVNATPARRFSIADLAPADRARFERGAERFRSKFGLL